MNKFILIAVVAVASLHLEAKTRVRAYRTKHGKYVASHYRSSRDHSKINNWSHKGNVNPENGKKGYEK